MAAAREDADRRGHVPRGLMHWKGQLPGHRIDDRAPFDPPDLFREQRVVRDVRLACCARSRLRRTCPASASLMISANASCRAQRAFASRCAGQPMPLATTASGDGRRREPQASRRLHAATGGSAPDDSRA